MERGKYFQSNYTTHIYLDALVDVIGRHGLFALLHLAGLSAWIENPPSNDNEFGVDFADFAALNITLEVMYGPRGGRALALRAGRASFMESLSVEGSTLGVSNEALKMLSPVRRVRALLDTLARSTEKHSDSKITVLRDGDDFIYRVNPCPACWGRGGADHMMCHGTIGYLLQALAWTSAHEYRVDEMSCSATKEKDDHTCEFRVIKDE